MSFSPIQYVSTGFQLVGSGGATPSIALPSSTSGNTVILCFGAGLGATISGITDSQENDWIKIGEFGPDGTDAAHVEIWSATAKSGELTVYPVIANAEPRGTDYDPDGIGYVAVVFEAPEVLTLDVTDSGGASVGGETGASVTTTADNDVIMAFWFDNQPGSAGGTQPATSTWPVFLAGNADGAAYVGPGGPYGGFMLAFLEAGAAGVYTCGTTYPDLSDEAPAGDWGATIVVAAFKPAPGPSSDIVTDICERAGLTAAEIDVSLLTAANLGTSTANIVPGYVITRPTPAKDILKPLMEGYFFGARETNGTMQFVPLGLPSAMSIPEGDLGLKSDGSKLEEEIGQEGDLPRFSTVTYDDPTLNYQQNKQIKQRNARIVSTNQQKILELPLTQLADWALQVGTKTLYLAWLERFVYKLNLWRAIYLLLDPCDVITFTYEGLTFQIRIVQSSIGVGLAVAISGLSEYAQLLVSGATGAQGLGFLATPLQVLGASVLWIFDIPLLRDIDSNFPNTGFYFAMSSASLTWGGGVLYESTDDSDFSVQASSPNPTTFGFATNTLGAPRSPWTWDRVNTLTVTLQRGSFASDTALDVCNGSNLIIVGSEIIQFQTATQNSDGSWTLSNLLRGRRGTEWACGTHGANELVVMPATGIVRVQQPLAVISQEKFYKGVTVGQDPSTATSIEEALTGADLKPYAPVQIKGSRDMSGNLTIDWIRRTRVGWLNLAQDPVPLSEDSELYEVDIYNGASVVRALTGITSPTVEYSEADQVADFGSAQASVSLKVFQISGEVGKGFAGVAAV